MWTNIESAPALNLTEVGLEEVRQGKGEVERDGMRRGVLKDLDNLARSFPEDVVGEAVMRERFEGRGVGRRGKRV